MRTQDGLTFLQVLLLAVVVAAASSIDAGSLEAQALDTLDYRALEYRALGPGGNRASAVVGEPANPAVAYVGAASGGVWKTTDGGAHWRPVFDGQPAQSISALAVASSRHNEVWAGTGETFIIRSATSVGDGIYKSTDYGESWTRMGLEKTGRIARIVVDPQNADIVYACATGHGFGPQPERGVYRTTDGGRTWKRVLFVDENTGCSDIAIDAHNPRKLFAGMWQLRIDTWNLNSGGPSGGVFVTHDGGDTWQRVVGHGLPEAGDSVGKIAVAVAPSDPDRVYALIEERDPSFYRSDDGGATWKRVSRNHTMDERAPYYTRFAVSPDDENLIYFVSVRFSMSRDGGATLADDPPAGGGDNHDIWIDPTNGDRFMVAHDGGASITLNRGRTFLRVVLPIAQMYHVYTDTRVPYYVYGNRQDDESYTGPSNSRERGGIVLGLWHSVGGCESGFAIPDTVNNQVVWSGCYDGGLERYDLATGHARNVRVWPEGGYGWPPKNVKYRWNWTFPIALSPQDPNKVYVGSQYVHMTTDGGASWTVISPDLTRNDSTHEMTSGGLTADNLMTFDGATLFAIAESPVEAGVIWAGSNDGLVHVTRDAGQNWTDVTGNIPNLPPWGKISNIEPSHYDSATAYISVDLHEMADFDPYIYKTTDFGRSWKRVNGDLPKSIFSYVHVVREDPQRPGMLYAGTENSVYFSLDDGAHWHPLQNNLPHAPAYWLTVQPHFSDLVVATYGRGIWVLDDITPLRALNPDVLASDLHLFGLRPAYRFRHIHNTSSAPNSAVQGENPPYGADIDYFLGDALTGDEASPVTIAILDANGDTVRSLKGTRKPGINRVWWDLRYEPVHTARLRTPPPDKPFVMTGPDGWRRLVSWDLDLTQRGALAAPGNYTVVVSAGNRSATGTLSVVKDPNTTGSQDDIQAQVDLSLTIRAELDTTVDLINRIEWIRRQLQELRTMLAEDPALKGDSAAAALGEGAKALGDRFIEVEGQLFDVHLTGAREDAFRAPMKLYGRLSALLSDVQENSADFPPTTQQVQVNDALRGRLGSARTAFEDLMRGEFTAFKSRLRAAHIPDALGAGAAAP